MPRRHPPQHRSSSPSLPWSRALAILGLALAAPTVALAAPQVKGKLVGLEKLMNPVWAEAKESTSHRFSWREPSPTVRAEFRNLFAYAPKEVCVAALASSPQQPPALPLLITLGGGRTSPVTVVVAPGTRLHFENRDPFAHRLYAVGQSSFPPGDMVAMATRDWTAPGPGKYELRDENSPSVRSWVVVDPHVAAIAYPNTQGVFSFSQLAAGEYTIKTYFGGSPVGTPKAVAVTAASYSEVVMAVVEGVAVKTEASERE
jgi:plastocyanin